MTKPIAGTKTEQKLLQSYFAESATYAILSMRFRPPKNYFPVERIFNETAANELRHAKVFFKFLPGGAPLQVDVATNPGIIGDTASNLTTAAEELRGVDATTMKPPGLPAAKASTTSPTTSRP